MFNSLMRSLIAVLMIFHTSMVFAIQVTYTEATTPRIQAAFPDATHIGDKIPLAEGKPAIRTVFRDSEIIGYAFESNDVVDIPAYSGKPVNMLVMLDSQGTFRATEVLEHHEPILLVGIPEEKLIDFARQYPGLKVTDRVRVGNSTSDEVISVDAITGATVTVMVVNETVMRSAVKVARALGIAGLSPGDTTPPASINKDLFAKASWQQLTGDGSVRRLTLSRGQVDEAFTGTAATAVDVAATEQKNDLFIDLFYAPLNVPTIGRNLLGDREFEWLMGQLNENDQAIAVFGNGRYSFKGNGYVRGGIFDRTQIRQGDKIISFHDSDYYQLSDVFIEGYPGFQETAIYIIRDKFEFDPGTPWQLELLVRRQVGALDSVFTSFYGDYVISEAYITRPEPVALEPRESTPLWVGVWEEKSFQIGVISFSLGLLTLILFLQDWLTRYPRLLHYIRQGFLTYTVFFIGWYSLGQLSVVNVFTFVHALFNDFRWGIFLLDPILFILWGFVAISLLLWGRGIFCGWLCPFGALQELINEIARKLRIRQYELPFSVHERLWAIKYVILLVLFAVSLESLSDAERYAEVKPFKTTFLLNFQREWGYAVYAGLLLVVSLFTRKVYCRYICPLGAALAIPSRVRLFNWLKRRSKCGQPCRICANECEIQAIHPDGTINANECHHCLDCQMTYHNDSKCPPLVARQRKINKRGTDSRPSSGTQIPSVDVNEPA